ncbi:MAG: thymidylate kinase [Pseudomonadota bacterium]|jgi:dTMP kinase
MAAPFIVFEGLDGAGTTTQAHRLVAALESLGHRAHFTREPSDGPLGTMLRQALAGRLSLPGGARLTPETLALLFAADRTDHLAAEVRRLTASGVTVVCDRYVLSSIAYQGQELDPAFVRAINTKATPPDVTLYVRVTPETALQRRSGRHLGDELYEKLETQRRVAARYDAAAEAERETHRVVTIDGEQSIEAVSADVLAAVRPHLDAAR